MASTQNTLQSVTPKATSALVLIAEDEPEIAEVLSAYLHRAGIRTMHVVDGQKALNAHSVHKPDLVLLDVQMPLIDGWRVLSEIRHRGDTPVIMLTAQDQDIDKLTGLRIGADDYVVKPFNVAEVVARVQAVLRRTANREPKDDRKILRVHWLELDLESYTAFVAIGRSRSQLDLTLTEFKLLVQMARTPQKVFTRFELLESCMPEAETLERTIDSHVSKLRRKLEDLGVEGMPVSVRGVGYKLVEVT